VAPVARPDHIRSHNLALLLGHLHRHGEQTRAALTQSLGMSRSTIGALVGDLTALGLVEEIVPIGGAGVGRPSHYVVPHHQGPISFGVDVDPPAVVVAATGIGGSLLSRVEVALEGDVDHIAPESVVDAIARGVALAWEQGRPTAVPCGMGVSVPGTIDRRTGQIDDAPNLGWRDVDLRALVAERLDSPSTIMLGNDADLALLAEHRRGSLRGCSDAVFIMGRRGVGAGIMTDGRALHGRSGHAGEIGHNTIDPGGPPCHCGNRGCLEVYVGEAAMLALAGRDEPVTRSAIETLFADARAGAESALAGVTGVVDPLARAIAALHNTLSPERVVLGGSLAGVVELLPEELTAAVAGYCFDLRGDPGLVAPELGLDSALLGAAELGFAGLLADPLSSASRRR